MTFEIGDEFLTLGETDIKYFLVELGTEADTESFWQQVKTNLQAGRIRLVSVADEISTELRRIVEFLNEQMGPAEVFAYRRVGVTQYTQSPPLKTGTTKAISRIIFPGR